ncbi:MAG: hypothetical protein Q8K92_06125 [Leadbetterella sp.]|nr:hypothetical protein [Leadbetterella sp.]
MNYANHDLRAKILELKNRLYNASKDQFSHQLQFFFLEIDSNLQYKRIINEVIGKFEYSDEKISQILNSGNYDEKTILVSNEEKASFSYQFLKYFINQNSNYKLHNLDVFKDSLEQESHSRILELYISPIINHIHDSLDESSTILYLLEKYKKKTEWFTSKELQSKYKEMDNGFETLFENDLSHFLFEQDINLPFITTTLAFESVKTDGEVEPIEPIVAQIVICDKSKNFEREALKTGFSEIVKYVDKFDKRHGFLVVFNMNSFDITSNQEQNGFVIKPKVEYKSKVYHFIIVNISNNFS